MNINAMRRIDFWVGIPICFLLDILNYFLNCFGWFKKSQEIPKKVLFIKLSEMGSIILAYPLINKVKNEYPGLEVFFLTFKKNKQLIELLGIAAPSNILTLSEESTLLFILDTIKVLRRLKKERVEVVFDLEFFSRFTAILAYLSWAQKKIGFYRYTMEGLYRGNWLTHRIQYNSLLHVSKSYLSMAQVLKTPAKTTPELAKEIETQKIILPGLTLSQELTVQVMSKLKTFGVTGQDRLFLINPGEGTLFLREWPLKNFISLCTKILEDDMRNYLVIVGNKGSDQKIKILYRSFEGNKRCIDLAGKTTLLELLQVFSVSEALIINDSGLAHLASLTPIKKFVFFGPESPRIYAPLGENTLIINSGLPCSPCLSVFNHRNSTCEDNQCLKIIGPDEVHALIKSRVEK